jgi:hypothetical protein
MKFIKRDKVFKVVKAGKMTCRMPDRVPSMKVKLSLSALKRHRGE